MLQNKEDIVKVIIAGTSLILFFAIIIIGFVLAYRRKHLRHVAEKEKLQTAFQNELLLSQLEIREQTLKNVSQEIHDNIGQTLGLARMTLNMMHMDKDASFDKIYQSQELVGKALEDLRSLSKTMDTDVILSNGLINTIERELQMIEKTGAFSTTFKIDGEPCRINPQKELILFRIVQEALHNAMKHSQANQITVSIAFKEKSVELNIEDDGCGFIIAGNRSVSDGSGLRNMRNRIDLVGGSMFLDSYPQRGTRIQIYISNGIDESNNSIGR